MHLSAELDECLNTLPVPITNPGCPYRSRYVYGYGVDGSDRPSYLLWPRRGHGGHFWLMDPWTGRFFDPATADFLAPIGLEHFFDAFALIHKRSLRVAAATALRIPVEDVLDNLVVKQARAAMFRLTPIWVPEEPPAKRAKKTEENAASTQDVSMSGEYAKSEKESSEEADSDSAPILTSAVKTTLPKSLTLTNLKKHIRIFADSLLGWTQLLWNAYCEEDWTPSTR